MTDGIKAKIAALIQEDLGMTALIVIFLRINGTKYVNPALPKTSVFLIQNLPPLQNILQRNSMLFLIIFLMCLNILFFICIEY